MRVCWEFCFRSWWCFQMCMLIAVVVVVGVATVHAVIGVVDVGRIDVDVVVDFGVAVAS